jgi:translocation and assembly module TamB
MTAIIFGLWRALQSPYFASIIANHFNERVVSKVDAEVNIGNIEFSLFPPATHLNNISIVKDDVIKVYQSKLSLNFSVWDFLSSEFKISEIEMKNGYIELLEVAKKDNKPRKIDNLTLFDIIQNDVLAKLPVIIGELNIENVDLVYDNKLYPLNKLEIRPYKHSIDLELSVNEISYEDYSIDGGDFKFEILKDKTRIIESVVFKNKTKLEFSGSISNKIKSDIKVAYKGRLEEFLPLDLKKHLGLNGSCDCLFEIKGDIRKSPIVKFKSELSNVSSKFANIDSGTVTGSFANNKINITKASLERRNGQANILEPIFINLDKFSISKVKAKLVTMNVHDILYFLGPDFEIINGLATGVAEIDIKDEVIGIKVVDDLEVDNFFLGYEDKILAHDKIIISNMKFLIGDAVGLEGTASFNDSALSYNGIIDSTGLDIKATSPSISFEELGGELGATLKGRSAVDAHFVGPFEKVMLNLKSDKVSGLNVLGYSLPGDATVNVGLNLTDLKLNIYEVNSLDQNKLKISGDVDFNKSELQLDFDVEKVFFDALPGSIKPIWKEVNPFLKDFDGQISGALSIGGKFDNLRFQSSLSSNKVSLFNEPFSSFTAAFYIDNDGVFIDRVIGRKDKAVLELSLDYLFKGGLRSGKFNVFSLKLNDLNVYRKMGLGYDGTVNIRSDLDTKDGRRANLNISILKSSVGRKKLKPSNLNLEYNDDRILLTSSLLGGKANINGVLNIGDKKNDLSQINSSINIEDLKTILGIVSLHNIYDTDLRGYFSGRFSSSFRVGNLKEIDFSMYVNKFRLQKLNKFLTLTKVGRIYIKKSNVEDMSIEVRGTGGLYNLKGQGNLNNDVKLEQSFNLDLSFARLISSVITQSTGRLYGRGVISGKINDFKNYHELNAEDVSVKLKDVPITLTNGEMKSILINNVWNLNELKVNAGGGTVTGRGSAEIVFPFPSLNYNFKFDSLKYPVAEKSTLNFGGDLALRGKKFPYLLNGDVVINSASFNDEFTEFKSDSSFVKSVDKYIDRERTGLPEILELDINTRTLDSIRVKNRLADILFNGDFRLRGNPLSPIVTGQLNAVPTLSRFKFKGNDFLVNFGAINLDGQSTTSPMILNFSSEAKVDQYDVKMNIVGAVDDLQIKMESNPSLSQEDIFSLLTLGVTSDFSKNLEEKDKASLTTIGIGTLLVDQLKINEGLDSTLGLKLSVLPEVSESDDSPIQASQSDQSSRVRTATKLRIQKKVTKDVGLTFSNTFGGEEGNKQEMNIDFNINEQFSIQGVFEKDNDPNDDADDSSVGADIKYKWSF